MNGFWRCSVKPHNVLGCVAVEVRVRLVVEVEVEG